MTPKPPSPTKTTEPEFRCICPTYPDGPNYSLKIIPECNWHSPEGFARRRAESAPSPKPSAEGTPDLRLLVKLGSIIVHADELLSPMGHEYDKITLQGLIADPEVQAWIKKMGALLPLKRSSR